MKNHLKNVHKCGEQELTRVMSYATRWVVQHPYTVTLPPNGSRPAAGISVLNGFRCMQCPYITANRKNVINHCSKTNHGPQAASLPREWEKMLIQTFSKGKYARYWTVSREGGEQNEQNDDQNDD